MFYKLYNININKNIFLLLKSHSQVELYSMLSNTVMLLMIGVRLTSERLDSRSSNSYELNISSKAKNIIIVKICIWMLCYFYEVKALFQSIGYVLCVWNMSIVGRMTLCRGQSLRGTWSSSTTEERQLGKKIKNDWLSLLFFGFVCIFPSVKQWNDRSQECNT